jgi:hypothetical protein
MTWQWVPSAGIAVEGLTVKEAEAVEIFEDFHGLLHGFTFAALGPDVN